MKIYVKEANTVRARFEFSSEQYDNIKWALQLLQENADCSDIIINDRFRTVKGSPLFAKNEL